MTTAIESVPPNVVQLQEAPAERATRVFVYGTLRKGLTFSGYLSGDDAEYLGKGTIDGKLYQAQYPLVVLTELSEGHHVIGEIYLVTPSLLATLDQVENIYEKRRPWFHRMTTQAQTPHGTVDVEVYAWDSAAPEWAKYIPSGDYISYYNKRVGPADLEWIAKQHLYQGKVEIEIPDKKE